MVTVEISSIAKGHAKEHRREAVGRLACHSATHSIHGRLVQSFSYANKADCLSFWSYQVFTSRGDILNDSRNNEELAELLIRVYPDHPWQVDKFLRPTKSSQRMLLVAIQDLFPNLRKKADIQMFHYFRS